MAEHFAFFHLTAFAVTWLASRIGEHSRVHTNIAEVAIVFEVLGMFSAVGWEAGWSWAQFMARASAVPVVVCFLAVALTDHWWQRMLAKIL